MSVLFPVSNKGNVAQAALWVNQWTALNLSGAKASLTGGAFGSIGVTKVTATMTLQRYASGSWKKVKAWSATNNTSVLSISKKYSLTKKGKYRMKLKVTYYKGSKSESMTTYSVTRTY